jgi:hypothetical protein
MAQVAFRKFGYLPDLPDARDFPASEILGSAPVPRRSDNRDLVPFKIVQDSQDCVANAVAAMLLASHISQGVKKPVLASRRWIYYCARATHGATQRDAGTYIRAAFDVIKKLGFCAEDAWKYGEPVNRQPGLAARRDAYDQRSPTDYRRIWETGSARVDVCKRALAQKKLVVFGTDVAQDFGQSSADHDPIKPKGNGSGHAMVLRDHEDDVFSVLNWWDDDFAYRLSAEYIAWDRTRDLWIGHHAPLYSSS